MGSNIHVKGGKGSSVVVRGRLLKRWKSIYMCMYILFVIPSKEEANLTSIVSTLEKRVNLEKWTPINLLALVTCQMIKDSRPYVI